MINQSLSDAYKLAKSAGGYFPLPPRCWLELTGEDRVTFLHNFCTADIKKLPTDSSTELFILDRRGKTQAFGHVICLEDRLLITTASAEQSQRLLSHLDMYLIREQVTITDRSAEWQSLFVVGAAQSEIKWLPTLTENQVRQVEHEGAVVVVGQIELASFGSLLVFAESDSSKVHQSLESAGVSKLPLEVFDILRGQAGIPAFGHEIDENNLPQELRRDAKAISFVKGCYLGQETVAKIDAFGNVARFLVGIRMDGPVQPTLESEITVDDKKVGVLKSVVYSPELSQWLGLGFIKCKLAEPRTPVMIGQLQAEIVELPI